MDRPVIHDRLPDVRQQRQERRIIHDALVENYELVAAHADEIEPLRPLQFPLDQVADELQHEIARLMAEIRIVLLEIVDVEERERQPAMPL